MRLPPAKWSTQARPDDVVALSRIGRLSLLAMIALALVATILIDATSGWSWTSLVEICALVACTVFVWKPWIATILLMSLGLVAVLIGAGGPQSIALGASCGLVLHTCSRSLAMAYSLVAATVFVAAWADGRVSVGGMIALFAVAISSGLVGAASRLAVLRHRELESDLDRRTWEADEAVQRERERIADELHNVVAHDVTVVAMHARALTLMSDPAVQSESIRAISAAASQAMTDIRRILHVSAGDGLGADTERPIDVHHILQEARGRLEAAGITVEISIESEEGGLPPSPNIATTLRHVAQEAVNNVIIHAPESNLVRITAVTADDEITLSLWNQATGDSEVKAARGGYGVPRMRERVRVLDGSFAAGELDDGWLVSVTLPRT